MTIVRCFCYGLLIFLTACAGSAMPNQEVTTGDLLLDEPFDRRGEWQTYALEGVVLAVIEGTYRAYVTLYDQFVPGLNRTSHTDVIIETQAVLLSDYERGFYGVMCRADPDSRGYYFLVTANGQISIRRGEGRRSTYTPLVDWRSHSAVRTDGRNTIRAICAGDYLALYVNDTFVADVLDSTYASGYAGIAVGVSDRGEIDVAYEHMMIWEAE